MSRPATGDLPGPPAAGNEACGRAGRLGPWPVAFPKARRRRRWCSGSGCATPSAGGCGSPRTATSRAPSSGRSAPRVPSPDGLLGRVHAAPEDQLRRAPRPTGVASEAEYLEIGLARAVDPEAAAGRPRRGAARRAGHRSRPSSPARARWPSACRPRAGASSCPGWTRPPPQRPLDAFLARDEVGVERLTKDGPPDARRPRRRSLQRRGRPSAARRAPPIQERAILDTGRTAGNPYRPTRRCRRRTARRRRSRPGRSAHCGPPGAGTARRRRCDR